MARRHPKNNPDEPGGPCTLPPGCEQFRTVLLENLEGALLYMHGDKQLHPDEAWRKVRNQMERAAIAIGMIEKCRRAIEGNKSN